MKRKRFSVEQIVAVLKQAELGLPVADLVRQTGISEQTFYRWKKQYAGLESSQVRELKQLSEENARLKKPVADLSLGKAVLQDVLSKKFQASAQETSCRLRDRASRLQRATGLRLDAPAPFNSTKAEYSRPAPRTPPAHAGDRSDTDPLRLPTRAGHAAPGRLGG
jgi:putative transposase